MIKVDIGGSVFNNASVFTISSSVASAVDTYHTQNRGGRGIKGMALNEDDVIEFILTMSSHDYLMFFTNKGKVYRIKGYQVPNASRTAKGLPIVNLLSMEKDEKVRALISIERECDSAYLLFVTKYGTVKRVALDEFASIRQNGKIAITLRDGDELVAVKETNGSDEIIIAAVSESFIWISSWTVCAVSSRSKQMSVHLRLLIVKRFVRALNVKENTSSSQVAAVSMVMYGSVLNRRKKEKASSLSMRRSAEAYRVNTSNRQAKA